MRGADYIYKITGQLHRAVREVNLKRSATGLLIVCSILIHTIWLTRGCVAETTRLALPGKTWALELDTTGFNVQDENIRLGFKGRSIQLENPGTLMIVSVFLTASYEGLTVTEIRDRAFDRLKAKWSMSDPAKYEQKDRAFLEYILKDVPPLKGVNQKNVFIYMLRDEVQIDLHVSKVDFKPEDEKLFNNMIGSVKLVADYVPVGQDNFVFGSYFYQQGKYSEAIQYYSRAFEQEKQQRSLPESDFLIMIDNYGMAYGISGKPREALAVFEYGLSVRPDFPMFHYNSACAYSEMNDLPRAIQSLEQAFKFKQNMLKGEVLPDPSTDSSFQKYWNDPSFKALMKNVR